MLSLADVLRYRPGGPLPHVFMIGLLDGSRLALCTSCTSHSRVTVDGPNHQEVKLLYPEIAFEFATIPSSYPHRAISRMHMQIVLGQYHSRGEMIMKCTSKCPEETVRSFLIAPYTVPSRMGHGKAPSQVCATYIGPCTAQSSVCWTRCTSRTLPALAQHGDGRRFGQFSALSWVGQASRSEHDRRTPW